MKKNAASYTTAIHNLIVKDNARPTLISCGVDGWCADTNRIQAFSEQSPLFDLVICTEILEGVNGLALSEEFFSKGQNCLWACSSPNICCRSLRENVWTKSVA
jgi:hypothetical protein